MLLGLLLVVTAAGCASMPGSRTPFGDGAEFEVGKADHVNLWPLLDVKTGGRLVTSVVWPVFAYNPGERLTVRPVFSYYPDHEFNVAWPVTHFDFGRDNSWIGPVWWQDANWWGVAPLFYHSRKWNILAPLVFQYRHDWDKKPTDHGLEIFPAFGYMKAGSEFAFHIGPYGHYSRNTCSLMDALVPLYWYAADPKRDRTFMWFGAGLGGFSDYPDGGETWLFPFWYRRVGDRGGVKFDSLAFCFSRGEAYDGRVNYSAVIPPLLSWWGRDNRRRSAYVLGGLGHYEKTGDELARGYVFPFAAWEKGRFLSPLYARDTESELLLPLYYRNWNTDTFATLIAGRSGKSNWVAPLYAYNDRPDGYSFASLPYIGWKTAATRGWVVPPLLSARSVSTNGASWYSPFFFRDADSGVTFIPPVLSGWARNDYGGTDGYILWALGGWETARDGHYRTHWAWPFYYRDAEKDFWIAAPLLSGWQGGKNAAAYILFGLAGWEKAGGTNAALAAHWLLPLYYRNVSGGSFDTVLFGYGPHRLTLPWLLSEFRNGGRGASFFLNFGGYDVTPHEGNTIARYDLRHHMFPFYSVRREFDPDAARAVLEKPDPAKFRVAKTWDGASDRWRSTVHDNETHFLTYYSEDRLSVRGAGLVTGQVSRVERDYAARGVKMRTVTEPVVDERYFAPTGRFEVVLKESSGVFPFSKGTSIRTVAYKDAKLVTDKETYEFSSALNKVNTETNRLTGAMTSRKSFLYKVYQSKTAGGAHSTDIFPGYTHADRPDGFTSTSFLWRLYRYERDPAVHTTKFDFLFIPLWRSGD